MVFIVELCGNVDMSPFCKRQIDVFLTECGYFHDLSTKNQQLSPLLHRVIHKNFVGFWVEDKESLAKLPFFII
jgi:hypothetical protein